MAAESTFADSRIAVLDVAVPNFLLARVAVLDVDVRIMTSSVMAQ